MRKKSADRDSRKAPPPDVPQRAAGSAVPGETLLIERVPSEPGRADVPDSPDVKPGRLTSSTSGRRANKPEMSTTSNPSTPGGVPETPSHAIAQPSRPPRPNPFRTLGTRVQPLVSRVRGGWDELAEASKPVTDQITPVISIVRPAGWAAIGAAIVCYLVGRWLGWQEFLVLFLFLVVLVLGSIGFVIGRSTYAVTIDMARVRVTVGADAYGGLTVTNTSTRPLLSSLFRLPVGHSATSFRVPRLAGQASYEETFQVDTTKRAVVELGPVVSSRGDGLGLMRREVRWTDVQELFIHPKTISLQNSSAGFLKDLEGRPTDTLSSSDIAFHALRDYVVGDDLRHVHWKSSARIGKLLVRQFEETRRSHLVVCLDMSTDDYLSEDDFELAVSVAASLGQQSIREEKDVTIQVPTHRLNVTSAMRMLDDFSRLGYGGPVQPIEGVAVDAAAAVPDVSVAIIVAGTPVNATRLHSATARFSADVLTVVLRCEVDAKLSRTMIGSSPVLTIGSLDDLPRALRSLEN